MSMNKEDITLDLHQFQLLVYQHVVQLTLIDYPVQRAFAIAHRVAALAFDDAFTEAGLAAARTTPSIHIAIDPDETSEGEGASAKALKTQA